MNISTEAELYVIYANGAGYFTGKERVPFHKDLSKARFFNRNCDAVNSVARNPRIGEHRGKAIVIPVPVKADPKVIFHKVLKGK